MSRLVIRRRADRDIDEQLIFLANQSHSLAAKFLDSIERTLHLITESPDRGFLWDDETHHEREIRVRAVVGFSNVLVFYRTAELAVEIIRVLHGARDIVTLLGNEF